MDDSSNFQRNFSTGEVEVEGSVIYHKTEYRERRNHYAVFCVQHPRCQLRHHPGCLLRLCTAALQTRRPSAPARCGSIAHGWAPVGALHIHVTLAPGESSSIIFGLGYIENPQDGKVHRARRHQQSPRPGHDGPLRHRCTGGCARSRAGRPLGTACCPPTIWSTGEEKLDRMVNIWNQYQCMVTFNMSRSPAI